MVKVKASCFCFFSSSFSHRDINIFVDADLLISFVAHSRLARGSSSNIIKSNQWDRKVRHRVSVFLDESTKLGTFGTENFILLCKKTNICVYAVNILKLLEVNESFFELLSPKL